MATALEWILKLKDQMSGPAKKMQDAVKGLQGSLGGLASVASDMKDGFEALAANPIFGAVIDAYKLAGRAVVAGAKMAIDASSFKEDTIVAFESLVGGQQAAVELFDKADELAGRLGLQDEAVASQLRKLLTAGFSADTALGVVQAAADLAAARGAEAADAFSSLIATMEAKGKFDTKSMLAFAKIGIRTEDVYDSLAAKLKKTRAEVEALVKSGQIDAKTGIEAVLETVQGKFGGAGAKAADTFSKLLFRVKDALGDLFQDVDLTPLKDVLRNVLGVLGGPAGQALKDSISHLFGSIFQVLAQAFSGPEGTARLVRLVNNLAGAIEVAAGIVMKYGPKIVSTLEWLFDTLNKSSSNGGGFVGFLMDLARVFVDFSAAIFSFDPMKAADVLIQFLAKLFDIKVPTLGELLSRLWDGVDVGGESAMVGQQIVNGLIQGILGGTPGVISAMVSVATSAIQAAKSALGVASPSKVFEGIGGFTAQGFAAGVENDNAVPSAMTAMVAPPAAAVAARAGAAIGAAAGGGGRGGGGPVTIHIHGGDLDKVRRVVLEAIEDAALAATG